MKIDYKRYFTKILSPFGALPKFRRHTPPTPPEMATEYSLSSAGEPDFWHNKPFLNTKIASSKPLKTAFERS